MAHFSLHRLSASNDGRGVKVAATATPGTNVHTTTGREVIDIEAYNGDTVDRELTLEWAGTGTPDNQIKLTIPPKAGLVPVAQGLELAAGLSVAAFAAAANVIVLYGRVTRINE